MLSDVKQETCVEPVLCTQTGTTYHLMMGDSYTLMPRGHAVVDGRPQCTRKGARGSGFGHKNYGGDYSAVSK